MIQTSDKTNAAGKSVRQMDDDEVRARLRRIAGYNRSFAGTHHVVTEGDIYGYMTEEWHVDPAVYGISAAPSVVRGKRIPWLPDGEKAVVPAKKKGAAREI